MGARLSKRNMSTEVKAKRAPRKKKTDVEEVNEVAAPVVKTVGRKSKKPVKIVAVVTTSEGIEGNFSQEPRRPLIAHLQIHSSEVKFHDMPIQYDPAPPSQPEPYELDNMFSSIQEELADEKTVEVAPVATKGAEVVQVAESAPMAPFTKVKLMVLYEESSAAFQLPATSDLACFWCAHNFENQPCVIPEREDKGVYRVYGNFCCPECAVSYLVNEPMDPHVRWERMALLHRIYDQNGYSRIFPAPARETLKHFGGPMTIESFRATVRAGKVRVDVHMPPMVSILGSIDTKPIDFFDSSLKGTTPLQPDRSTQRGDENLRLKRSKPLKDINSTLDSVMNIQIKGRVKI